MDVGFESMLTYKSRITGFKLELMTPTTLAVVFSEKVGNLASEEVTRES